MQRTIVMLVIAIALGWLHHTTVQAQGGAGEKTALQGQVRSQVEGLMEGVLVRAKKAGGTIAVTVVTNSQGKYRFPANRLGPGTYQLSIRAAGYELAGSSEITLAPDNAAQLDLTLEPAKDLAPQLMNAEWLMSLEGIDKSRGHINKMDCVGCHSLTRILASKYKPEEWPAVLDRMANYGPGGRKLPFTVPPRAPDKEFAAWLSSVNLNSADRHPYKLKTLPRPKGRATRVVITEYDVPTKGSQPHEVLVDPNGMVWYADFVRPNLLKMDSGTGRFTEFRLPDLKPGFPAGSNCLEIDKAGSLWMAGLKQGGIFKFDQQTEQFTTWRLPSADSAYSHSGCFIASPDGTVWGQEMGSRKLPVRINRLDPTTGRFTSYDPFPDTMTIIPAKNPQPQGIGYLGGGVGDSSYLEISRERRHGLYGPSIDSKGTYYIADIGAGYIDRINPDTKTVTLYETPTPDSGPRRMDMDRQDRLWFAEYRAGKIGMFDTKTATFKEWPIPTPFAGPYDVGVDKNGEVWAGGMHTDYLYRLDPETGEITQYLLPTVNANIRNLGGVDNRTNPVTVWIGETHQGKIARVEPFD